MKFKILFIFSLIVNYQLSFIDCVAQQTFVTTGSSVNGSGGSVSFSIGQISYQTHSGNGGSIAEGIQHAYEIFEISISDYNEMIINCQVYPNPTSNLLQLHITDLGFNNIYNFGYSVLDINGKLLLQHEIVCEKTEILVDHLPKGVYILNILSDNIVAKSFKVVKN